MAQDLGGVRGRLIWFGLPVPDAYVSIVGATIGLDGMWNVQIRWYMDKTQFDENLPWMECELFKKVQPIPYVPNSDPINAAKQQILNDEWLTDGVSV